MQFEFLSVDEQLHRLHDAEACADAGALAALMERFDACWIYHDLSVEGAVFRDDELERALRGQAGDTWRESQLLDKIRHMREAIGFVRESARECVPFELDFVKEIHRRLQEEGDESAGRYRKDGGSNTAYRHEIVPPKSISYRLRKLVAFVLESEPTALGHPLLMAARIHRELVEIFPFANDNGLVARLAMNFWILRHGYAPAVIPVGERQRYFDCYLCENGDFRRLLVDAVTDSGETWIRGLQPRQRRTSAAA